MDKKLEYIYQLYPDAHCELIYHNVFELLIAVVLSAQTTDVKVNMSTKVLFEKYKTPNQLANANIEDVKEIIKPIGIVNIKSKHIIEIARIIHEKYDDVVPCDREKLLQLPGVGNKTVNVLFAEGFKIPAMPVDTHINRIAKRLMIADVSDSVEEVEKKLKDAIEKPMWIQMHHSLIFFGRYMCKAISPNCQNCKLNNNCRKKYK